MSQFNLFIINEQVEKPKLFALAGRFGFPLVDLAAENIKDSDFYSGMENITIDGMSCDFIGDIQVEFSAIEESTFEEVDKFFGEVLELNKEINLLLRFSQENNGWNIIPKGRKSIRLNELVREELVNLPFDTLLTIKK